MQQINSNQSNSYIDSQNKENGKVLQNNNNGKAYPVYSLPVIQQVSSEEEEDSIDLRQILTVVKHRLRLISAIAITFTTVVAIWTLKEEPRYLGTFQLLVESPTDKETDEQLSFLVGGGTEVDYDTQIEVLKSPSVLKPLVEKINKNYPQLSYEFLVNKREPRLKIEQLNRTKILKVSFEHENPQVIEEVMQNLSKGYLNYSLQEQQAQVNQGIEYLDSQLPELYSRVDKLQAKLQQFRQRYNFLNPTEHAELLATRRLSLEENLFNTQVQLNEAKSLYGILQNQLSLNPEQAIAASYLSESPRYQNLLDQLQKVELEIANKSAVLLPANPIMQELFEKRDNLLPLLQKEANLVLGNKYDQSVSKSFSLASPSSLRLNLNQEFIKTANQLKVLEVRSQALTSGMQNVEQQINLMPVLARQYTDLNRQLNVATNSLDLVLKEKENLKLEAAKQALPWQMIAQPEITDQPVYPQPVKNLSLGLFGGLILGMGAALLAERLDPVYHSLSEIKEAISLPILGEIPLQKDLQPLSSQTPDAHAGDLLSNLKIGNTRLATTKQGEKTKNLQAATPFLEAFRSLNTNIRLLGSDNPINSLVISSSVPSEGKSTISSHLAQAAAAMGQRVLIIDADLRRPQVHHWLGKKNVKGLSNYLATGASLEEIIQPVDAWENLHMISAGEVPPDPTRLLASAKMQEFRNELKERNCYDLIIYDTPPVGGFADGRILANHTNGIILVLRVGKTDRSAIKQNIDTLKTANVPILGIIANGVSRGSHSSYYYERYYSRQS